MKTIERILITAERQHIKQSDIAKAIGKGTSQITNWKTRNSNPPIEHLPAIAKLLNVSVEWLITGEESKNTSLPTIQEDEQRLLNFYNQCCSEGQSRIMEQAEFIAQKYPKQEENLSTYKIG